MKLMFSSCLMSRLGFHIPPYNSVNHLHLHVQALPYKTGRAFKYPISAGGNSRHKGFSWFAQVDQVLAILKSGGRVGIFAC
jgi:hypothetical protein